MLKKEFNLCGISYIFNGITNCVARVIDEDSISESETIQQEYIPTSDIMNISTILSRKMENLTLQLTQNCNLRCCYCPYTANTGNFRLHNNLEMSVEVSEQALNFFHKHSIDSKNIRISFYGGEPLLSFNLIKHTINYANSLFMGKKVEYYLTTNGTLLNNPILEVFVKHSVNLAISLDGPPEINDSNRQYSNNSRSVFYDVYKNIEIISNQYPHYLDRITIMMCIDPALPPSYYKDFFRNYPLFIDVKINASIVDDSHFSQKIETTEEFIIWQKYESFLALLSALGLTDDFLRKTNIFYYSISSYISKIEEMINQKLVPKPYSSVSGPCLAGHHKLFVNVNGDFFPCEKVSEKCTELNIGNLYDGFFTDNAFALANLPFLTKNECMDCWAHKICDSCLFHATSDGNLSKNNRLDYCKEVKSHALSGLKLYTALQIVQRKPL